MKNNLIIFSILVLVLSVSCGKSVKNPYVQEYIPGQGNIKGNVNIESFVNIDEAFDIGADNNGIGVFKDPERAFEVFIESYSRGINLIKEEFDLQDISPNDYADYKKLGCQASTGNSEEEAQARFVSVFLDIYENSY